MRNYQFKRFISTQEDFMNEIKRVIDLKSLKEIGEDDFTDIIALYYLKYCDLVFVKDEENVMRMKSTPSIRLGKKRIKIIGTCLEVKGIAKLIDAEKGIFIFLK